DPTLVFQVDDCQAIYERLKAAGGEFTQPATDRGYGIAADAHDLYGNTLVFIQLPGAQEQGQRWTTACFELGGESRSESQTQCARRSAWPRSYLPPHPQGRELKVIPALPHPPDPLLPLGEGGEKYFLCGRALRQGARRAHSTVRGAVRRGAPGFTA